MLHDVETIRFNAEDKTPEQVEKEIRNRVSDLDVKDKIILIRVEGILKSGHPSEINLRGISNSLKEKGAKTVKRNIRKLSTKEYIDVTVEPSSSRKELENKLIKECVDKYELEEFSVDEKTNLTKDLLHILSEEKREGEKNRDYNNRIFEEAITALGIKKEMEGLL